MAWFFGSSMLIIGFVMTMALGWADIRQPDSYDQTRINGMFNHTTK